MRRNLRPILSIVGCLNCILYFPPLPYSRSQGRARASIPRIVKPTRHLMGLEIILLRFDDHPPLTTGIRELLLMIYEATTAAARCDDSEEEEADRDYIRDDWTGGVTE